ncbi:cell wall integrity and stress response component 4-like [Carassius auratus]|uniref:Cell wall integrity and stress response component 4-like n=1 Tax=Carassius auratus TaxID=7957 RepID=A0A6P6PJ16_CARAU|nr:cell wall integrity and stress response component 4-like [Carassius auratus]
MADKCHLCLLGLIFLSSLLTGLSGVDDAHVFISSGEDVRLPCNNALHDCNSTTWIYNRFIHSGTVELFAGGIKTTDTERHKRRSLESDCSLNIKSVTEEDCGSYFCRQYVNDQQQGTDARVYLHVLHVSSSEISAGRSVTLFCQLYSSYSYPQVSCDAWIRSERIDLFWVSQAGVKLTNSDSRYQISFPSDRCIFTLTTTILNEDHNREWRCEVTQRDQLKTSVSYTVKISARADSETAVTSVHITTTTTTSTPARADSETAETSVYITTTSATSTPDNQKSLNTPNSESTAAAHTSGFTDQQVVTSTTETTLNPDIAPIFQNQVIVIVIVVGVSVALLLPALILWLIRKKRADVRRETDDSVEQTDDVTYTEVTVCSKNRAKKNKVRCDDKVTYASIRGTKAGAQENCSQLYASVNKNHHKSDK